MGHLDRYDPRGTKTIRRGIVFNGFGRVHWHDDDEPNQAEVIHFNVHAREKMNGHLAVTIIFPESLAFNARELLDHEVNLGWADMIYWKKI